MTRSTQTHYDNGKDYDLIDVISDYELNFNRGNIIKYVCRAGKKGSEVEDLEKAMDYLRRELWIIRDKQNPWKQDTTL
jgi:hypothetical protein